MGRVTRLRGVAQWAAGVAFVVLLVAYGLRTMVVAPSSRMIGTELDSVQYLWGIWWLHAQASMPEGLFGTTWLANYPAGAQGMVMAPLSALIAGPVLAWKGPVAAYNFAWIFNLLLMAAGVAMLARQVTGSRPAALVAALVMVASRPPFFNVAMGQLHGGTVGWVGLGGALWWAGRGRWHRMLLGGILMGFALVESPYAMLAVGGSCMALAIASGRHMVRESGAARAELAGLMAAAVGVLLVAVPQAYLLLVTHASGMAGLQTDTLAFPGLPVSIPVYDDIAHRLALWDFFNPFVTPAFDSGARVVFLQAGAGMYLGVVGLGLSLACRAGRRWALVSLAFMLVSLGSTIRVGPLALLGPFGVFNTLLAACVEPLTMPDLFGVYAPVALAVGAALGAVRLATGRRWRWCAIAGALGVDAVVAGGPSIETPSTVVGGDVTCVANLVANRPGAVHYIGARNRPHGIHEEPPEDIASLLDIETGVDPEVAERRRLSLIQGMASAPAAEVGRPFLLQAFHHQPSTQTGLPPRWTFLGPTDPRVAALTAEGHPVHRWLAGEASGPWHWTWDLPVRWVLVQDLDGTLGNGPLGSPVARCGDLVAYERPAEPTPAPVVVSKQALLEVIGTGVLARGDRAEDATGRRSIPGGTSPAAAVSPEPVHIPEVAGALQEPTPARTPSDRDGDGIVDSLDACPLQAETRNGFWDDDGCPEADTDGDGVLDPADACPKKPETVNGVWDQDGCPEADRDGDGVVDALDPCPRKAETVNGLWDDDGCPEYDTDGDGILDPLDMCKNKPETKNGLWDQDGCPEPDRDRDGIPDVVDDCPRQAETINGIWDGDGCPELDTDHDGVIGPDEACPKLPETRNGLWDDDGCPERDRDHDGIVTPLDLCPTKKETVNGLWDEDGCPEPDTDRDGVPDPIDGCPATKETRNGFLDQDGCPDEVPSALDVGADTTAGTGALTGDRDGDGIPDHWDRCPEQRETVNGWRDQDGCPENDQDGDGIVDARDRCPGQAETMNGFWDTDGCPEEDADRDGIPAPWDRCPDRAENVDGRQDADGCPEEDIDGDGIAGPVDRCPKTAETRNGYRDQDGCPEKDSDNDGLIDIADRCPRLPETVNAFRDDDGCPEKDPDGDGILAPIDRCPRVPETRNGFRDQDGCPEKDTDHDGIVAPIDRCPRARETVNGFRDDDGCPERDRDHDGIPDLVDRCPLKAEKPVENEQDAARDGCP